MISTNRLFSFSPGARLTRPVGGFAVRFLVQGAPERWALGYGSVRSIIGVVFGRSSPVIRERDRVLLRGAFQQRSAAQAETKVFFQGCAVV